MIFHGYFRSSAAWRCRIAFNLKGLSYEFRPVHLRRKEQRAEAYLALNPQGLVPALEVDGKVLTQSLAIIEWLDETQAGARLLPDAPFARAEVRAFAQMIAADMHPLQNLRVLAALEGRYGADQAEKNTWCALWLRPGLEACEALAAAQTHGGAFTFGDAPGLADICLIPQLASADRFGVDITDLRRLAEIRAACEALEAFASAAPDGQPDAE
ncbi:MAG: maleylacetoacetate isomerase [Candidatus Kaistia colombiensis]|nr:MAG: maleylacetoacetate isomerase [Kaistia sp.]